MKHTSKHKVFATPGARDYETFEKNGFGSLRSLQTVEICLANNKADAIDFFASAGVVPSSSTAIRRTSNRSYLDAVSKHPVGTVMWSPASCDPIFVVGKKG